MFSPAYLILRPTPPECWITSVRLWRALPPQLQPQHPRMCWDLTSLTVSTHRSFRCQPTVLNTRPLHPVPIILTEFLQNSFFSLVHQTQLVIFTWYWLRAFSPRIKTSLRVRGLNLLEQTDLLYHDCQDNSVLRSLYCPCLYFIWHMVEIMLC